MQVLKSGVKLSHNTVSEFWGKTEVVQDSGRGEMKQKTLTQTQFFLLNPHDIILRGGQDFTVQAISSAADTSSVL